jgi:hypothetical protein
LGTMWTDVDGPVLRLIANQEGESRVDRGDVVRSGEWDGTTVTRSLVRLRDAGLVDIDIAETMANGEYFVMEGIRVTGLGLQRLGEWPPNKVSVAELSDLVRYLEDLADAQDDPEAASRLRAFASWLGDLGQAGAAQLLAALAVHGITGLGP